jgi:predicted CXXCH cytochrome family protein
MIAACKGPCESGRISPRRGWKSRRALPAVAILCLTALPAPAAGAAPTAERARLPYHNGPTLVCADCHVTSLHARPAAPFASANSAAAAAPDAGSPAAKFASNLKTDDVNELCQSCHTGTAGVPDVMGSDINGLAERSAGFFGDSGRDHANGHVLGPELTCVDCHAPHGNGRARNLRLPSDPGSDAPLGLFVRPEVTGLARYERRNVAYGTLDSRDLREVSALCLECHGNVAGSPGARQAAHGGYLRHPSYDSQAGQPNHISDGGSRGSTAAGFWDQGIGTEFEIVSRVPFVTTGAADFLAASEVDAGRNGVFCLSCHSAHGSQFAYGLRWSQTGRDSVAGCSQCHATVRRQAADPLAQVVRPGN